MAVGNLAVSATVDNQAFSDPSVNSALLSSIGSPEQVAELISLRQQSARLEHLLEVMPTGVVVVDGQGKVKQANKVAIDLLGEPLLEEMWRTIIARSFKPQADDGHEVSLQDGRKVKLSMSPLADEPGQLIVLTDLTETRQLQQRISHMQKLSSLGKMVASLAHQIRTPLSAAMLYADNLNNINLPEQARDKFSHKLVDRLKELEHQVNDMLLFAKSGEQQVVSEISVQSLFAEIEASSEVMLERCNANLSIHVECPQEHDTHQTGLALMGNPVALSGAIQNLIHNSLQVKPEQASIHLNASVCQSNPQFIQIEIQDNGPGLDENKITQIFEPFVTTKSQGTGLGLAVVKSVVKSHHGRVFAYNLEQGGACFRILIPRWSKSAQ